MRNLVSLTCPSLQILGKTQIEVFLISRFLVDPLLKKSVVTPEPLILTWTSASNQNWEEKQNIWWKKLYDDVMSANCDFTVIFLVHGQFTAIQKPDSKLLVCKAYIFIKVTLYVTKTKKRTKKSNTAVTLLPWVRVLFFLKILFFCKKMLTLAKLRGHWYCNVYFLQLHMCVLRYQIGGL